MGKRILFTQNYVTTHQANKHTPPYHTLILCSCRCPLTYCSLLAPPTICPLGTPSPIYWLGWEGVMGQRAAPPSDEHWRGRATKLAAAAATDYDMFLYHLFVCLFFAPLIDASTMQPVPTCDVFTFFIRKSIPLTGRISRDAEKPS
jgi:hypothetical protein